MAVDGTMRRSLREGFVELLVRSLRPAIEPRQDIAGGVSNVKNAFSSWDNCMAATYCKWPVIAIMIVGGLIIFSVVWCIIRCACCGLACCCSCCNFLKCCGNCCGCCDPPRGKRHKYLDEPYIPPNQGYKVQPPMNPHFPPVAPTMTPATSQFTGVTTVGAVSSTPQYAEFDVSKKGGEDALPAMPSWEGADKKKVYLEEEEVEMDQLKKPEPSGQNGAAAAGAVGVAAAVPGRSPVGSPGLNRSPYGPPAGVPANNGYFPAPGVEADPYGSSGRDYNSHSAGYGQPTSMNGNQGYGMATGTLSPGAVGPGRRSPYNDNGFTDAGYGQQGRGYGSPARQDSYNTYGSGRQQGGVAYDNYNQPGYDNQATQGYGSQQNQGYGMGARRSPPNELPAETSYGQPMGGYNQEPSRHSPGPQAGYGNYDNSGYDSQPYSNESSRPLRPPPQRQYTNNTAPQAVQSDAGFDFGASSYSRPAAGAGGYRQPSPVQQQQANNGYPGYKPYSPVNSKPPGGGW